MTLVHFSENARRDVLEIVESLSSVTAAAAWRYRLIRVVERLATFPNVGRGREDLGRNVRSIAVEPAIAFYRVDDGVVVILRVIDARRDMQTLFG